MPFTDEQIETLRATDPAIVKEALGKMTDAQRSELSAAVSDYDNRRKPKTQAEAAPQADWQKTLKPFTLSGGAQTVLRPQDNAVYIKPAESGPQAGVDAEGWYKWEGNTWKKAPDAPVKDTGIMGISLSPALSALGRITGGRTPNAPTLASIKQGVIGSLEGMQQLGTRYIQPGQSLPPMYGGTGSSWELNTDNQRMQPIQGYRLGSPEHQEAMRSLNENVSKQRTEYESAHTPSAIGEMAGAMLIPSGIPGGAPAKLGGKMLKAAIQGGIAGVMSPVYGAEKMSIEDQDRARGIQAISSAALGASIPGAVAAGSKLWDTAASKLAGTKFGDRIGIKTEIKPEYRGGPGNPGAIQRAEELEAVGIKSVTPGDVTGDLALRAEDEALLRRDPRMMRFRQQTADETAAYADKIVNDLKRAVSDEKWSGLDDLQRAVEKGGKRGKQAAAILSAVEASGDDWKQIAKTSGNLNLMVEKLRSDALYDRAEAIANMHGAVPTTRTLRSAKHAVNSLVNEIGADSPNAPHMLQDIVNKIEDGNEYNFGDLRELRSKLNNKISQLSDPKAVSPALNTELDAYKNVLSALEEDLDKFAKSRSSGLRNSWKQATDHYRERVVPYKDAAVGKALADQDPVKLVQLLDTKNPYQQTRAFELLGPKGQQAVRLGIIQRAVEEFGEKTKRGTTGLSVSPAAIANKLEVDMKSGIGKVAFGDRNDIASMQGMIRIMRTVDRVSNLHGRAVETGKAGEMLGAAEKTGLATRVFDKATGWVNRENLLKLHTDPKGRALLRQASMMSEKWKEMDDLVVNKIPKFLGYEPSEEEK